MKAPAFTLRKNPAVSWPVRVRVVDDGGTVTQHEFTAEIRVLPEAEFAALFSAGAEQGDKPAPRPLTDVLAENARTFPQVVVGWSLTFEDGKPIDIAELPAIITGPYGPALSAGLHQAIAQVRYGYAPADAEPVEGATEGNSAPPPATGSN